MCYKNTAKLTILFLLLVFQWACKRPSASKVPDVSHINVTISMDRFDQALMGIDTSDMAAAVSQLYEAFPVFAPCYFQDIIGVARPGDSMWYAQLQRVLGFPGFRAAYDSVQQTYPSTATLQHELEEAFRYHAYYHPNIPLPSIRLFTSEYGYGAVACNDTILGIGLDLFLGADFPFYTALQFPQYLIHRMTAEHILPSLMQVYWQSFVPEPGAGASLLDHMLYHGKLLYYLDLVLPKTPDRLKIGYTDAQLEWVAAHEEEIWAYLLDNDRLFETNISQYAYLINEGPTTQGMPSQSPGKVARWVGWQMVKTYRVSYDEEPLAQLWQFMDGQVFLERSDYKPGR